LALILWVLPALAFAQSLSVTPATQTFTVPQPDYKWDFPRDHGAHPEFQTEWWYFTGQLVSAAGPVTAAAGAVDKLFTAGADYGFQLTFFRRAIFSTPEKSSLSNGLLAHAALSDIRSGKFEHEKRYQRTGLTDAPENPSSTDLRVGVGDWTAERKSDSGLIFLSYSLSDAVIQLQARMVQPVMLQGKAGFSRKGSCSSCASYYYSLPRLELTGTITKDGVTTAVSGLGWMDHEFMSNALMPNQIGWDWISLMTKSGDSIMYFKLRTLKKEDETTACALQDSNGVIHDCVASFTQKTSWQSPQSGARYPATMQLSIRQLSISPSASSATGQATRVFEIATMLADQELNGLELAYYEGAIRAEDRSAIGYAEFTGYDKPIGQAF